MRSFVLLLSPLVACAEPTPSSDDPLPPPREGEGIQIAYELEVAPGQEAWRCNVTDLPNPRFLAVNHVESIQNPGMHHMDLLATAFGAPELEPGDYDCREVYERFPRLMDDGVIIYASQQETQQIVLPPGTVADLLPKLRVMHEIHFVNPTDEPVRAFSKINAYAYEERVEQTIWGGAVRDLEIAIPPGATQHVEYTRCVMNQDVDVLFLSSHTHALARQTVIRRYERGAAAAGEVLYTNTDWHAPPLQDHTAAPLHVPAGTGFEFECHYANPTGEEVRWGFAAADEMCQIALVFTPGEATRVCEVVESGVR